MTSEPLTPLVPPPDEDLLTPRVERVLDRIESATDQAGRPARSVRLLLATKTQPLDVVRGAVAAVRHAGVEPLVGDNRVQELTAHAPLFAELGLAAALIGPLQNNKVNQALRALASPGILSPCVATVASEEIARALAERIERAGLPTLDVMVQVNVSGEPTKTGVRLADGLALCEVVGSLDHLRLTGLFTVGAHSSDPIEVRGGYAALRAVRDEVATALGRAPETLELSMGMSGDLEAAIAEGATVVRVGTAIFGARARFAHVQPSGPQLAL